MRHIHQPFCFVFFQELLERKADYCDHLLTVASRLCPGNKRKTLTLSTIEMPPSLSLFAYLAIE
jgi:hypothetical protein